MTTPDDDLNAMELEDNHTLDRPILDEAGIGTDATLSAVLDALAQYGRGVPPTPTGELAALLGGAAPLRGGAGHRRRIATTGVTVLCVVVMSGTAAAAIGAAAPTVPVTAAGPTHRIQAWPGNATWPDGHPLLAAPPRGSVARQAGTAPAGAGQQGASEVTHPLLAPPAGSPQIPPTRNTPSPDGSGPRGPGASNGTGHTQGNPASSVNPQNTGTGQGSTGQGKGTGNGQSSGQGGSAPSSGRPGSGKAHAEPAPGAGGGTPPTQPGAPPTPGPGS